jgi:hypothetical protein
MEVSVKFVLICTYQKVFTQKNSIYSNHLIFYTEKHAPVIKLHYKIASFLLLNQSIK